MPFFAVTGSGFVEMFVGVGASRVRSLFDQARKAAPAIVFVDEIDAIGARRSVGGYASNDEQVQTLNQLLVELDGFDPASGVVVMAATNRADTLDAALLRPGRFDRTVEIPLPTQPERSAILVRHCAGKSLAPDADLDAARDRLVLGRRDAVAVLQPGEQRRVAVHEGGHALVALLVDRETVDGDQLTAVAGVTGTGARTPAAVASDPTGPLWSSSHPPTRRPGP